MANYSRDALESTCVDSFATFFEPDVVLPSQFLVADENGIDGGERKLMAAILSDGIEAYIMQFAAQRSPAARKRVEACEWVETKDYAYVFSFDNVCECLGIDPEYLRMGLLRYVQSVSEGQNRPAAWKRIRRPRKH